MNLLQIRERTNVFDFPVLTSAAHMRARFCSDIFHGVCLFPNWASESFKEPHSKLISDFQYGITPLFFFFSVVRSLGHSKTKLHTIKLGKNICLPCSSYLFLRTYILHWVHHSWRADEVLTKCDFTAQIVEDNDGLEFECLLLVSEIHFPKTIWWK